MKLVYRTDLDATLAAADARRRRSKQKRPGPSEVGECRRRFAYRVIGQPVDNHASKAKAIAGTLKHKVFLPLLRQEHGGQIEVRLLDSERRIEGATDWIRQNPLMQWIVADLKTYGRDVFEHRLQQPVKLPVLYQVHLYADMLRRGLVHPAEKRFPHEPLDITALELIEYCRDDGRTNTRSLPYQQSTADEAWQWIADIDAQLETDGTAAYIPRDLPGPDQSAICRGCPFAGACWGWQPETEERRPLTLSEGEMRAWLIEYKDAADDDAVKDAKRRKELARAHLDGIPAQKLPDGWELRWKGGREEWIDVLDTEAAIEKFEAAGIPVPMKTITKRTARQIDVRRPAKVTE